MIGKPELSKGKERANELHRYLKTVTSATKQDICKIFNWEYNSNNDRRVREIIALLASVKPIIATSDRKGYKLAKDETDIENAVHEFRELCSRIEELQKRIPALTEFLEKHSANLVNKF